MEKIYPVDFERSAVPRYLQLATLFRQRIESGEWPIQTRLPTVIELASQFGVSVVTIRQALGVLESELLIQRFRAKGTFVTGTPTKKVMIDVTSNISEMISQHDAQIEVILEQPDMPPPTCVKTSGEIAPKYHFMRRRHSRDGVPYMVGDLYWDADLFDRLPRKLFTSKTAMRIICETPGVEIVDAEQIMTISTAEVKIANLLNLDLNAPIVYAQRTVTINNGCAALIAEGYYRGDMVSIRFKLK